jgi:predicted metalloprotease
MRLNPFDPSRIRVEDQRGRFPGGGGGKLGCGAIVVALIGVFVFGVDPAQMLGTMEQMQGPAQIESGQGGMTTEQSCAVNAYSQESCAALASLNDTWEPLFRQAGIPFQQPKLVFYSQAGQSGCGAAQSVMGPFYCPADQGIYIDTTFYDTLDREMGAGPGDFARYYVIAHEYGHHIQTLTGISSDIRRAQQQNPRAANQLQVLMELQADCYAGVWAGRNRNAIEPGDFEEGMQAASAIGDDTLMQRAGRAANPESFTHGTSQQRMQALRLGLETGDDTQCDAIVQ